jgi:hypothetical protein
METNERRRAEARQRISRKMEWVQRRKHSPFRRVGHRKSGSPLRAGALWALRNFFRSAGYGSWFTMSRPPGG